MKQIKPILILGFLCSYMLSLFFYETAKAWLSVSMFGLLGCAILFTKPQDVVKLFYREKALLVFSLSAVTLFLFMLNSENMAYAWSRIEVNAPLFGLAIAFAVNGKIERGPYQTLLAVYVLLCASTAVFTLLNYAMHYDEVTESYLRSQVMPTLINHVRYSIIIAMGTYVSYYLYKQQYRFGVITPMVFLMIAVAFFVFLHVYSVRSGLVAVYGMATAELIVFVVHTRKYKLAAIAAGTMLSLMVAAVWFIPTLHNKWVNTVADMNTYIDKGYPNHNSLTTRFISYQAAWTIFAEHPLVGCGIGDIKDQSDLYFKQHYPEVETPILPHNQFLFSLAATGIIGLLLFCITFYFPLFYQKGWRNRLLLMQYVILTLSFITEPMLETQLGMAYSMLFILLPFMAKPDNEVV